MMSYVMKTEAFESGAEKKRQILSFPLALSGVLEWMIGKNILKSMRVHMKRR